MIGIYGGTFDPVHFGHLRTALEVKENLGLCEVRFVPARLPPHRDLPQASSELRLRMLRLALDETEPGFVIDTRELEREGPSFMVDTLSSLRAEVGAQPLCLIVGIDAFRGLPTWHRWQELLHLAHLIVMRRPGSELGTDHPLLRGGPHRVISSAEPLRFRPAGSVLFQEVTQLDISASRIRAILAAGKSARYLLPEPVLECITESGLYRACR